MVSAALGFLGGVVVCGLVAVLVLPAVVRAQCAKTVRLYHEFMRPRDTPPVIVIERVTADDAPTASGQTVRRRLDVGSARLRAAETTLRVDSTAAPRPHSNTATTDGRAAQQAAEFWHVE